MKRALAIAALALLGGCNALFGFDDSKLVLADASTGPVDGAPPDGTPLPIDAAVPDANPAQCDPLAQTGCGVGEKCTWITIDGANGVGKTGCVADGVVSTGGLCTRGPDGETTGFDDCVRGDYCVGGLCETICSATGGGCDANQSCGLYSGLFSDVTGDLGLCDFQCDPVTQTRSFDGAAGCGGDGVSHGCYKHDEQPGVCATVPLAAQNLRQDDTAYNWPQAVYLNGCAAGYFPGVSSDGQQGSPIICVAYCMPVETSTAAPGGEGGAPGSGYTCADRNAAGHECHFFWFFEQNPTSADNGVGLCWTPANYIGNWDNDPGTPDTAFPACNTLQNFDTDGDSVPQNQQFGCAPLP